jgi:hypothetical protein
MTHHLCSFPRGTLRPVRLRPPTPSCRARSARLRQPIVAVFALDGCDPFRRPRDSARRSWQRRPRSASEPCRPAVIGPDYARPWQPACEARPWAPRPTASRFALEEAVRVFSVARLAGSLQRDTSSGLRSRPPFRRTSPSSRGLGHRPFTAVTGVRIPLGTPAMASRTLTVARSRRHHGHARLRRMPCMRGRPPHANCGGLRCCSEAQGT